jgi:hypothetical protein
MRGIRVSAFAIVVWNVVLGAAVFLPVFIAGTEATGVIVGYPFAEHGLANEASGIVLAYVAMSVVMLIGVLAHSTVLLVFTRIQNGRFIGLAAAALAPLVPLVPILCEVPGASVLSSFWSATAVATVAYGFAGWRLAARMTRPHCGRPE